MLQLFCLQLHAHYCGVETKLLDSPMIYVAKLYLPMYLILLVNTQLFVVAWSLYVSYAVLYDSISSSSPHLTMEMSKVHCSRHVYDSMFADQARSLENWPEEGS